MLAVVLIGWNAMDVAKAAIAINSALIFGFMGIFLVQQNVELERCEEIVKSFFLIYNIYIYMYIIIIK
jgi:hypothetical protein